MTLDERLAIMSELTPVCETGEENEIMSVLNKHFYSLGTARSIFCVKDPKYERDFLPPSRDFMGKGYLHSFLASRRIMNVKNRGEGGRWSYTYTISFDTNFPSYLRSRAQGRALGALDGAISECLKFLAPHRSGIDIMPYLFENAERIDSTPVWETLHAYLSFMHADQDTLAASGVIECILPQHELIKILEETLRGIRGGEWQMLAKHAQTNWAVAYIVLLVASAVHLAHPKKSAGYRLQKLLSFLDAEVGIIPQQEVFFAHAFFERGNQEKFFRHIQANAKQLCRTLRNMAWDLAHPRTILDLTGAVARGVPEHADFVIPYILTFDQPVRALYDGFQANGIISYFDDGLKLQPIFPMNVHTSISDAIRGNSEEYFDANRIKARLKRGEEFNDAKRTEVIASAESYLETSLNASKKLIV